jgi:hypothetical protein
MRGVRFTKAEADFVIERITEGPGYGQSLARTKKLEESVVAKLRAALEPAPEPGANAGALEYLLVSRSHGKVIALIKPNWPRLSRWATQLGVTEADAAVVGTWFSKQGWLRSPLTMDQVFNKWSSYLTRARHEEGPDLNGDLGPGTQEGRQAGTAGRRAPGLGPKGPATRPDGVP